MKKASLYLKDELTNTYKYWKDANIPDMFAVLVFQDTRNYKANLVFTFQGIQNDKYMYLETSNHFISLEDIS